MKPTYGEVLPVDPVRQKMTVSFTLPHSYPGAMLTLIGQHVVHLYLGHEKISAVDDDGCATVGSQRVGFRSWRVTITFDVMNQTSMTEYDQLNSEIVLLAINLGSRHIQTGYERVEQE